MEPAVAVPTFSLAGQASAWPVEDSQTEQARFSGTYGQRLQARWWSQHPPGSASGLRLRRPRPLSKNGV